MIFSGGRTAKQWREMYENLRDSLSIEFAVMDEEGILIGTSDSYADAIDMAEEIAVEDEDMDIMMRYVGPLQNMTLYGI